jgi:hypothetical protein
VRSRAAVKLLKGKGFKEVYNLKGGIMAWEGIEAPEATGPPDTGMFLINGNETSSEIVAIAYGMEKEVQRFLLNLS